MTSEEHRQFVEGLLNNDIFSSMHIHEVDKQKDLTMIFLPHAGAFFDHLPIEFLHDIGCLWEFAKEKIVRAHRGSVTKVLYPVFATVRLCSKLDWDLACDAIKALKARTNLVLLS